MKNYYCNKCGGTTHDADYCVNPSCPNMPCCSKPSQICTCSGALKLDILEGLILSELLKMRVERLQKLLVVYYTPESSDAKRIKAKKLIATLTNKIKTIAQLLDETMRWDTVADPFYLKLI